MKRKKLKPSELKEGMIVVSSNKSHCGGKRNHFDGSKILMEISSFEKVYNNWYGNTTYVVYCVSKGITEDGREVPKTCGLAKNQTLYYSSYRDALFRAKEKVQPEVFPIF